MKDVMKQKTKISIAVVVLVVLLVIVGFVLRGGDDTPTPVDTTVEETQEGAQEDVQEEETTQTAEQGDVLTLSDEDRQMIQEKGIAGLQTNDYIEILTKYCPSATREEIVDVVNAFNGEAEVNAIDVSQNQCPFTIAIQISEVFAVDV